LHADNKEHLTELCELAAREPDPKRLTELIDQMVRLINDKEPRMSSPPSEQNT
jgi:hypothetical protein